MSRVFAVKLAERVITMFLFAFLATYAAGIGSNPSLDHVFNLSLGQKAATAGIAAAVQLLLSTTVAPFVGDPNSPSLVPKALLGKLVPPAAGKQSIVVSLDDIVKKLAGKYPGIEIAAEDLANELVHEASKALPDTATRVPPKNDATP